MPRHGLVQNRWARLAAALGAIAAAVFLQLLRQPGARTWNTVWAEDGAVYLSDTYSSRVTPTVFRGYAGYVQVVPRLLAMPARVLSVDAVALYLATAAAAVWAVLALFVYSSTEGWISTRSLRLLVVGMMVLLPASYFEVNANIANVGWPLLFAAFWAVLSNQQSRWQIAARSAVVLGTALSTALAGLLLPMAVVLAAVRRRSSDVVVAASLVVGMVVQVVATHFTQPDHTPLQSRASELPAEYGVRVLGSMVIGERWLSSVWSSLGLWLVLIAALVVGVLLYVADVRSVSRTRWLVAGTAVAISIAVFVVPVWLRGSLILRLHAGAAIHPGGSRYVVVPVLLLVTALVVVLDDARRPWAKRAVCLHGLVLIVVCFGLANQRSRGPEWQPQVDRARNTCALTQEDLTVPVPITPSPGWAVGVPCHTLR